MLIKIRAKANKQRAGIFVDCGKRGSDWLAIASCDMLIENLLEGDQLVDYWIIPVMNPDGYLHTWEADRLWQKNRREITPACKGVYLDRNYHDTFENKQENPCANTYPGERPAAERETEYHTFKLIEFLQQYDTFAALTVHGWGGSIQTPYNAPELLPVAERMAELIGYDALVRDKSTGSGSATIVGKVPLTLEFYPRGEAVVPGDQIDSVSDELIQAVRALQAELIGCAYDELLVGNGKGDVTGTVTMANMMGFAAPGQDATGLHGRLYARAMYTRECLSGKVFVFVTIDNGMGAWAHKRAVMDELRQQGISLDADQIVMTGTHTHSGPAGYFDYFLFEVTSKGYIDDVHRSMTWGTVESIINARQAATNCEKCGKRLAVNHGKLFDANLNRSPSSYDKNDAADIEYYSEDGNTDKNFTQLTVENSNDQVEAMYNWFAVHPVAMNKSQTLINGDVKGWASQIVEKENSDLIAGFCSTNLGDVSPNINGHKCSYNGEPPIGAQEGQDCDYEHSTCPKNAAGAQSPHYCFTFGVGWGADFINNAENERKEHDMKESTDIIVQRQVAKAMELLDSEKTLLTPSVNYRHKFVDMTKWSGVDEYGVEIKTCKPSMGVAFGAGCTDGHGAEFFIQGTNNDYVDANLDGEDWVWFKIRDVLMSVLTDDPPTRDEYLCHGQKPTLLPTGWADKPYKWHPDTIELGVYQIGEFFMLAVPGEFTTMAGRYLREEIRQKIRQYVDYDPIIVITGLSNIYTHYITTLSEYNAQRYEAGSVIYGPNTLAAYTIELVNLVGDIFENKDTDKGTPNSDLSDSMVECLQLPGDDLPYGDKPVGTVITQPVSTITVPRNIEHNQFEIEATFVGGNPRNVVEYQARGMVELDIKHFVVERKVEGEWMAAYDDGDWETEFHWDHENWDFRFAGTQLDKEHKLVGPFAMFNYYAGIATGNMTRLDLLEIINDNARNELKPINFENYGRPVERQGNCGNQDVEDLRMHGYNLITTKLVSFFIGPSLDKIIRSSTGSVHCLSVASIVLNITPSSALEMQLNRRPSIRMILRWKYSKVDEPIHLPFSVENKVILLICPAQCTYHLYELHSMTYVR